MKKIFNSNGWLLVNKPEGIESFGVIRELKFRFKFNKIGFTGTLDPLASGLLLIGINKATKLIPVVHLKKKKYKVKIFFGASTDTQDLEGKYINYKKPKHNINERVNVLKYLIGSYEQRIPTYSAHKIKGKNFYEHARDNQPIVDMFKNVIVHSLKITAQSKDAIDLNIECESGFYVRSFAEEMAKSLGECGFAMNIVRYEIGDFKLSDSIDFQNILDFSDIKDLDSKIIPIYSGRHPG